MVLSGKIVKYYVILVLFIPSNSYTKERYSTVKTEGLELSVRTDNLADPYHDGDMISLSGKIKWKGAVRPKLMRLYLWGGPPGTVPIANTGRGNITVARADVNSGDATWKGEFKANWVGEDIYFIEINALDAKFKTIKDNHNTDIALLIKVHIKRQDKGK